MDFRAGFNGDKSVDGNPLKCIQAALELYIKVDYWCTIPHDLNFTTEIWRNLSSPILENGEFDNCHIFNISYNDINERPPEDTPTVKCTSWTFDTTYYKVFYLVSRLHAFNFSTKI